MNRQERMARGNYCPRGCGRKVHATHPAKSAVDNLQICSECKVDEIKAKYRS